MLTPTVAGVYMTHVILTEIEGDCMLSIMSHDQGFLKCDVDFSLSCLSIKSPNYEKS